MLELPACACNDCISEDADQKMVKVDWHVKLVQKVDSINKEWL